MHQTPWTRPSCLRLSAGTRGNAYDGSRRLVCSPMPASRLPFLPGLPEDQATMPVGMQAAPGAAVDRTRTPVAAGADIPPQRHHPRPAGPPRAATTNPARALTVVLTHYLSRLRRLPHRHSRYAVRSPSVRSAPHGSVPPVPHLPGPRLLLPTTWHSARIASTTRALRPGSARRQDICEPGHDASKEAPAVMPPSGWSDSHGPTPRPW
jgi:hypothetical protein